MTEEQLADLREFAAELDLKGPGPAGYHLTLKFAQNTRSKDKEIKAHPYMLSVNGKYSNFATAEDAYRWASGLLMLLAEDKRREDK